MESNPIKPLLREARIGEEDMRRILGAAAREPDAILVGGQSLAFWLLEMGLLDRDQRWSVTRDADFFVARANRVDVVAAFAKAISGSVVLPHEKALTALIGQAVRFVSESEYLNVDVISRVAGTRKEDILRLAIPVEIAGIGTIRVLDPITLLQSKVANLHKIPEKQNDMGIWQAQLSILCVREYLRRARARMPVRSDRDPMLKLIARIGDIALGSAGRGVLRKFDVHPADAIDPSVVTSKPFLEKRLPQFLPLMSSEWRARIAHLLEGSGNHVGPDFRGRRSGSRSM